MKINYVIIQKENNYNIYISFIEWLFELLDNYEYDIKNYI